MKVYELIEELKKRNSESIVLISGDEEGNDFGEVVDISNQMMTREFGEIEIHEEELTPGLKAQGFTEEDIRTEKDGAKKCIVLWPDH